MARQWVLLTVTMDCGHVLTYTNTIEEKYPFWCPECEESCGRDYASNKWPWVITTEIVTELEATP